jgi:hypothetical protein
LYLAEQFSFREVDAEQTILPMTTGGPYNEVPVKHIPITDLDTVAYIDIRADGQYVNENLYNCMHSEYLTATLNNGTPVQLIRPMGANWDHADHYAKFVLCRIWKPSGAEISTDVLTLTLICYAASTASHPGDVITIKYMDIQVNVFRNEV